MFFNTESETETSHQTHHDVVVCSRVIVNAFCSSIIIPNMEPLLQFHAKHYDPAPMPISPFVPVGPAISTTVEWGFTICFIVLYGLLFFLVYAQLFLILYYEHRRVSYQTFFLFLCLIWAGLRTTVFSFYIQNDYVVNKLNTFFSWLLFSLPVCLQFTTLCLLVLFFAQVGTNLIKFSVEKA